MSDQQPSQQPFGLEGAPAPSPAPAPISDNDKLLAGLCYISQFLVPIVLPVILLLSEQHKRNAFVRQHSITSLGLFGASAVWWILSTILMVVLAFLACILWVLYLVPIVPFLYYGIKAFQGQTFEVPYLTKFMRQQGWQ